MRAFVITVSSAPPAFVARDDCPIPSRRTLPPPNTTSSPYDVKSFSISMTSSVSARRTRSPTLGPNRSAYCLRGIFTGPLLSRKIPIQPHGQRPYPALGRHPTHHLSAH